MDGRHPENGRELRQLDVQVDARGGDHVVLDDALLKYRHLVVRGELYMQPSVRQLYTHSEHWSLTAR